MNFTRKNLKKIAAVLLIAFLLAASYFIGKNSVEESEKTLEVSQTKNDTSDTVEIDTQKEINDILIVEKTDETVASQENKKNTDSAAESPVEPALVQTENDISEDFVCTLYVKCDTINQNIQLLDESKRELIPSDGVIYARENVVFQQGESVFDVLLREMKNNKIHFEYVKTPMYDGVYIEGINNIYEFDCGAGSGWLYNVNGEFPGYSCSQYELKNGDIVRLIYTCDMGKDVGKG